MCVRERERQAGGQADRQHERERIRESVSVRERERETNKQAGRQTARERVN